MNGLEDVTIRLNTPATAAAVAISSLAEFSRNCGVLRVSAAQPDTNIGLMHEMPAHFTKDYPHPTLADPEYWDVIVRPESGFNAQEAASALRGHQLTNTRFIFPQDGAVLTGEGFSTRLDLSETVGRALQTQLPRRSQQLHHAPRPSGLRGMVSELITRQLNDAIRELSQQPTSATKDVVPELPRLPRPPFQMSAADRAIFRQCVRSLS